MPSLGIVADDVTGATTVGALIAREGVKTTVLFDHDAIGHYTPSADEVLITSTDSRALPADEAHRRVKQATMLLQEQGVKQFSKRTDTTFRGGVGPELEGMLAALGDEYVAVVVPAMPQSRRIVIGGYSLIDSVLLSRTAVAHDLRTPVLQSHLPTLLKTQLRLPSAHVGLADVLAGKDHLAEALLKARGSGARVFVIDAADLDDVDMIAMAVCQLDWKAIAVDPGPFTDRMGIRSGAITAIPIFDRELRLDSRPGDEGTVMVVAGSATDVTHRQISSLARVEGSISVSTYVLKLISEPAVFEAEVARVEAEVTSIISAAMPRVLILALETVFAGERTPSNELEAASGLQGDAISELLTERLGAVARRVADLLGPQRITGFYLTGGDVMINVCHSFDANGITLVDYVIPQIDQGRIAGGPFDGISVVCKGGLTGDSTTAIASVNRIFDERKSSK